MIHTPPGSSNSNITSDNVSMAKTIYTKSFILKISHDHWSGFGGIRSASTPKLEFCYFLTITQPYLALSFTGSLT
jgi:hypothetical protein